MLRPPEYRRHKARNKGYVCHGGKMIYFPGAWESGESRAAYDEFVDRWLRENDPGTYGRTVGDLVVAYCDWAEGYYRKGGQPTPYVQNTKGQLKLLFSQHRRALIRDFDSAALEAWRDSLDGTLDRRCKHKRRRITRQYINKTLAAVLRMFQWGVRKKMVRVTQYDELRSVPGLQRSYCKAPEAPKVQAANDADVDATLPFLRPPVRAMVHGLLRLIQPEFEVEEITTSKAFWPTIVDHVDIAISKHEGKTSVSAIRSRCGHGRLAASCGRAATAIFSRTTNSARLAMIQGERGWRSLAGALAASGNPRRTGPISRKSWASSED